MRRVEDDRPLEDDETLSDDLVDLPTDPRRRAELLDQRFVHGLLRANHTADAAHRESRVAAVLDRLDERAATAKFWLTAAIVLVSVFGGVWFSWPAAPPRAEAMVQRALEGLNKPVNRRYGVEVTLRRHGRVVEEREYTLTTRGPRRFLLEGPSLLGPVETGCDGEEVWARPSLSWLRWSKPWQPGRPLGTFSSPGQLDTDDVDLSALLGRIGRRSQSMTVDRIELDGESAVRITARDVTMKRGRRFSSVVMEVGEASGEMLRLEITRMSGGKTQRRIVFEYRGVAEVSEDVYRRPW